MYLKKPTPTLTPRNAGVYKLDEAYIEQDKNKTNETKAASGYQHGIYIKSGTSAEPTVRTFE